jgi:hypothetical protein
MSTAKCTFCLKIVCESDLSKHGEICEAKKAADAAHRDSLKTRQNEARDFAKSLIHKLDTL